LKPGDVDRLGQALIMLTEELWVLRDRQKILEALLEDAGVMDRATIDAFAPDAELGKSLAAERRQLIDRILAALGTSPADPSER